MLDRFDITKFEKKPVTSTTSYKEICSRLSKLSTAVICDAFPQVRLMRSTISPITENLSCIGRAYTVNSAGDSLSTMKALDDLQAFLAVLNPDQTDIVPTILVIAACGSQYALAGGMCARAAKASGFGGIVIDGPCRDVTEIKSTGLPFFAEGICAKSGTKDKVGNQKRIIECGDVRVEPGDIIFADNNGVVVLNYDEAVPAIKKAEGMQLKEDEVITKIESGVPFNELSNIDEHVENIEAGRSSTLRLY
jgi:4-hydroxy-4-methyl-2-oxoglutarate aldolase